MPLIKKLHFFNNHLKNKEIINLSTWRSSGETPAGEEYSLMG